MKIGSKLLTEEWQEITEVGDGSDYLIQNLGHPAEYVVQEGVPAKNDKGGILSQFIQLAFKKKTGKLYMRSTDKQGVFGDNDNYIYIERVE